MTIDTVKISVFALAEYALQNIRDNVAPHYSLQVGEARAYHADPDWLFVAEVSVDIPRPSFEQACDQAVASFRERKRKLQAETGKRMTAIDAAIGKLLAISNEPSEA